MTTEQEPRYTYRTCPCFAGDVEGIQTWLEDLAAEGLLLEADGTLFGVYTFRRAAPCTVRYRLVPIRQKKGFFNDTGDGPDEEEAEFTASCGWEYLLRCGSFYVYRAADPAARPLHTDPEVHAMALQALKRQQRGAVISEVVWLLILFGLRRYSIGALFLTAALTGPLHVASLVLLLGWLLAGPLVLVGRLSHYQKRLRRGDTLDARKDWQPRRWLVRSIKLLPAVLALTCLITWGISLRSAADFVDLEDYRDPAPFATVADVFPGCEIDHSGSMGDYNTALHYETAAADNYEWNELAYVTVDGTRHHCILRLKYHVARSEWFAKGLADDYYCDEAARYRGKRFEVLPAPETALDNVRGFRSYGILHIVVQHGCRVAHAVVTIDGNGQENQWHLWLQAMEAKLLSS